MKYIKRLFLILIIICCGLLVYKFLIAKNNNIEKVYVVNSIDKYGYTLYSNNTEPFRKYFNSLDTLLNTENYDEKEYASLVAKLFIIDFYTLENKSSNLDIGGTQFVHSKILNNFKLKSKETIYRYVENNIYGDRNQDLPYVTEVNIDNIDVKKINNSEFSDQNSYYIDVSIEYKKDLGFDSKKSIILVHENEKLSLVSIN